jgi:signal transduction histidine kinase
MSADRFLYFASVIVFTFGALTFCVLTAVYWRERRQRKEAGGELVFPAFTLVCATAFVTNLALQTASALGIGSWWVTAAGLAMTLATGLLPPLLFHVIYDEEQARVPGRRLWRWLLAGFYAASAAGALLEGLEDREAILTGWSGVLDKLPAVMFGVAGALGLAMQISADSRSTRALKPAERRHRFWVRLLLALMLLSLAANGMYLDLLPDYLVLAFFCITLYYKERLVFFDLLVKRGAFFAVALLVLTSFFFVEPRLAEAMSLTWGRPWIDALLLTPFWLMAPWIYSRLALGIDRIWLRRRYSQAEAERRFTHAIQAATGEEDLRTRSESGLSDIFQTAAKVDFQSAPSPDIVPDNGLRADLAGAGRILLEERPDSIPFLSDDRRLLQSLARTLSVVLENVRFRQEQNRQREREEHLSWLASRSELKALRAQINPHFLFNALNAIAGLIPTQPRAAEETVEQLAEIFRYTLRKSEKEWVRLDEEVEFVMSCLRVEQARFGERLRVSIDVDPALGAVPVPAMSIQPLVENAIKHGASMVEEGGEVRLRAALDGANLRVEVWDNGPGFPPGFSLGDDSSGHGLRNIAERLKGYCGAAASLVWERHREMTRVVLVIPRRVTDSLRSSDDTRIDRG